MAMRTNPTLRRGVWTVAASVVCLALLGIRLVIAPEDQLGYMAWNLGLAWIPVVLGWVILRAARGAAHGPVLVPAVAAWILFLPNAPYLLTDLVHLRDRADGIPALDLVMLAAFALTGLLLFVVSVAAIQEAARLRLGHRVARGVVPACIWLSSAGIYLGRVLRWNSWDVLADPVGRVGRLLGHLGDPATLAVAAVFTAGVGACLHVAYAALVRFGARAARVERRKGSLRGHVGRSSSSLKSVPVPLFRYDRASAFHHGLSSHNPIRPGPA
jgi:uncharacterized membrane protein